MPEKPGYKNSIYNQFFASDDADVQAWGDNQLEKMYKPGVVPNYIIRGRNNNDNGEDDDYRSFWKSMSYYFAWVVIYARRIMDIKNNPKLIFDYLIDRNMGVAPGSSLAMMQFLVGSYYDEIRKRGTKYVFEKADAYSPLTQDMLEIARLYGTNNIDGEFLRLIAHNYYDEMMVTITPKTHFGTVVDRCSYMYRGTSFDNQLIKGYEDTDEAVDLTKYPLINPPFVSIVNDSNIGKDVLQFDEDIDPVGIGWLPTYVDATVTWNVGLVGSSNIQLVNNTTGKTIGNAQWTGSLSSLLTDLVASVNSNTQDGSLINGSYPFDNSAGFTASFAAGSPQPYDLVVTSPPGSGSSGNGVNIGLYVDSGTWTVIPSTVNGDGAFSQAMSGGTTGNPAPYKKIVIDPAVNYEITCQLAVGSTAVQFNIGVDFFDNYGFHLSTHHIDGNMTTANNFVTATQLNISDKYYAVRAICFGVNEATRSSANSVMDIGWGKHIQIPCGAKYMIPRIVRINTGSNRPLFVYDFKVRIADTVYTKGFIQVPNAIQVWAKPNNGSYSRQVTELNYVTHPISYQSVVTVPLLEEFVRRYLIPYNSIIIFNWLGAITACGNSSYDNSYNDSYTN